MCAPVIRVGKSSRSVCGQASAPGRQQVANCAKILRSALGTAAAKADAAVRIAAGIAIVVLFAACVGTPPDDDPAGGPDAGAGQPGDPDAGIGPGSPDAAAEPGDPDAGEPARARVVNTGGSGLNLREGPGTEYAILANIPDGAAVDLLGGVQGDWLEVRYQSTDGWAHGDYLIEIDPNGSGSGGLMFLLPWTAEVAYRVTQGHNRGSHTGNGAWAWDFGLPEGTPLLAAHDGVVRRVKSDSTTGGCSSSYANDANYVVLDRGDGLESLYLHMKTVSVTAGQAVSRGDLLGTSGQTGWACGAHLHFQIQKSPSGGGGQTWYNPSVSELFHDTGSPLDPPEGSMPVSKNGVIDLPGPAPADAPTFDPHGGAGDDWDRVLRRVAD
jgi:murein DD-endopeptidase MepM/ murein hydrolase activator NlpD